MGGPRGGLGGLGRSLRDRASRRRGALRSRRAWKRGGGRSRVGRLNSLNVSSFGRRERMGRRRRVRNHLSSGMFKHLKEGNV